MAQGFGVVPHPAPGSAQTEPETAPEVQTGAEAIPVAKKIISQEHALVAVDQAVIAGMTLRAGAGPGAKLQQALCDRSAEHDPTWVHGLTSPPAGRVHPPGGA